MQIFLIHKEIFYILVYQEKSEWPKFEMGGFH